MSWLFSRALAAEYLPGICSDGEPSALSNSNPTPQAFLSPDKMTGFSRLSQFGMTFAPLTASHGEELLTLYRAGFLAKTLARPVGELELPESEAASGAKCHESFARWNRDTCSWKTRQFLLLGGSASFSETWPDWGTMRGGECSVQTMRGRPIVASGSGLWPTPRKVMPDNRNRKAKLNPKTMRFEREDGESFGINLADAVRLWTTPTKDGLNGGSNASKAARKSGLPEGGGSLNPTWVEWLMGWPLGWTDSAPLEMDKFQRWRRLHGEFCEVESDH